MFRQIQILNILPSRRGKMTSFERVIGNYDATSCHLRLLLLLSRGLANVPPEAATLTRPKMIYSRAHPNIDQNPKSVSLYSAIWRRRTELLDQPRNAFYG